MSNGKLLSRDEILQVVDITYTTVDVPEWGGVVRVRGLTGRERDAYEASAVMVRQDGTRIVNPKNLRAKMVVMSVVDDAGKRLFSDEDIALLGAKSAAALERVFDTARHLSGMTEDDMARLEQDFDSGQDESSPTD